MTFRRLTYLFAALLTSGFFSGLDALEEASWGQVKQQTANINNTAAYLLTFNPAAAARLGEVADGAGKQTASPFARQFIGPEGGTLRLHEDNLPNHYHGFWGVELSIPPGALAHPTEISMRVHGTTLADLVVEFGPSGLVFEVPATLTLAGSRQQLDLDQLESIQHIAHDGTAEALPIDRLDTADDGIRLSLPIPGFSRYSLYRRSSYRR